MVDGMVTQKKEAEAFAEDIKRAHKLIGNTSGNYVSVKKQKICCKKGLGRIKQIWMA